MWEFLVIGGLVWAGSKVFGESKEEEAKRKQEEAKSGNLWKSCSQQQVLKEPTQRK